MSTDIQKAVALAVATQSPLRRYKGSLLIIAGGLVSIAAQLADSPDLQGTVMPLIMTVLGTVIAAGINRFTPDGVTPAAGKKIEQAAQEVSDGGAFSRYLDL